MAEDSLREQDAPEDRFLLGMEIREEHFQAAQRVRSRRLSFRVLVVHLLKFSVAQAPNRSLLGRGHEIDDLIDRAETNVLPKCGRSIRVVGQTNTSARECV